MKVALALCYLGVNWQACLEENWSHGNIFSEDSYVKISKVSLDCKKLKIQKDYQWIES